MMMQNTMRTTIELADVAGHPRISKDLPAPLRIGDRIRLAFRLSRVNGGRHEVLEVQGAFKVTAVAFDAVELPRQLLQVEAIGKEPTWKAIKKVAPTARRLAPARSPRTEVT